MPCVYQFPVRSTIHGRIVVLTHTAVVKPVFSTGCIRSLYAHVCEAAGRGVPIARGADLPRSAPTAVWRHIAPQRVCSTVSCHSLLLRHSTRLPRRPVQTLPVHVAAHATRACAKPHPRPYASAPRLHNTTPRSASSTRQSARARGSRSYLALGQFHQHLGGGRGHLHGVEDGGTVVGDGHLAVGGAHHLVHAARP
jgi:hypothetical protein